MHSILGSRLENKIFVWRMLECKVCCAVGKWAKYLRPQSAKYFVKLASRQHIFCSRLVGNTFSAVVL